MAAPFSRSAGSGKAPLASTVASILALMVAALAAFSGAETLEGKPVGTPLLLNVTSSVFPDDRVKANWLPMAFGDFNSDKLTDVFVVKENRLSILLAQAQSFAGSIGPSGSSPYFMEDAKHLECSIPSGRILSVVPGDFDGDGGMDVFLTVDAGGSSGGGDDGNHPRLLAGLVLWGEDSDDIDASGAGVVKRRLACRFDSSRLIPMTSQPILIEANGDYTADLFGSRPRPDENKLIVVLSNASLSEVFEVWTKQGLDSAEEQRGVWYFATNRRDVDPQFEALSEQTFPHYVNTDKKLASKVVKGGHFRKPFHSNAFVDVNGDGNADLFVTGEIREGHKYSTPVVEIWINEPSSTKSPDPAADLQGNGTQEGAPPPYVLRGVLNLPNCSSTGQGDYCLVGQAAFFDVDLDGKLDVLLPVCFDSETCKQSAILTAPLQDLLESQAPFKTIGLHLGDWRFDFKSDGQQHGSYNPYEPLTLRVGDINLDGFPDLLVRLREDLVPNPRRRSQLLLNIPWTDPDEAPSPGNRGFWLQEEVMESVEHTTLAAAFFDLYEDGVEDLIVVHQAENEMDLRVGAFTNATKSSDAYFVKIIVLSGACYDDSCPGNKILVPYGTNSPGQTICYRTQRPEIGNGFATVETCSAQLAQTSHTVLGLPYTIFGLGLAPNFLDVMFVNVTNATSFSRSGSWPQIIPNSQMYVIPYPPTSPHLWAAKLFVTPSRSITLTAIALLGTCALAIVIIGILHWREKRQDRKEKLQEAHRFHFDAM